jgi:hypothetical protein
MLALSPLQEKLQPTPVVAGQPTLYANGRFSPDVFGAYPTTTPVSVTIGGVQIRVKIPSYGTVFNIVRDLPADLVALARATGPSVFKMTASPASPFAPFAPIPSTAILARTAVWRARTTHIEAPSLTAKGPGNGASGRSSTAG